MGGWWHDGDGDAADNACRILCLNANLGSSSWIARPSWVTASPIDALWLDAKYCWNMILWVCCCFVNNGGFASGQVPQSTLIQSKNLTLAHLTQCWTPPPLTRISHNKSPALRFLCPNIQNLWGELTFRRSLVKLMFKSCFHNPLVCDKGKRWKATWFGPHVL